jgi:hypothetical protein
MESCLGKGRTLAKTVYTEERVTLQDGKEIILRPLVIGRLKKAMAYVDDPVENGDTDSDGFDFLVSLSKICLEGQLEEDYDLEMSLDAVTAKRIILVSTGIDFDDQNLVMAAAAAAAQSGQNSTS